MDQRAGHSQASIRSSRGCTKRYQVTVRRPRHEEHSRNLRGGKGVEGVLENMAESNRDCGWETR